MKVGIICGHDINEFVNNSEKIFVDTIYGKILINYIKSENNEIFFINRHGKNKNIPPHKINYKGNIQALKSCKIDNIISILTVGSMKKSIKTGDFVIPDDFIDFTKSRCSSYYDIDRVHIDMSNPFCPSLREILINSCKEFKNIKTHNNGIYLTTEGPRLETVSEINLFSNFSDIVGMTLVPEIVLAREKNICYASICIVCNMATGLQKELKTDEISKIFLDRKLIVYRIIINALKNIRDNNICKCRK
jgi:5'-methylthioadenosine phosphorylase